MTEAINEILDRLQAIKAKLDAPAPARACLNTKEAAAYTGISTGSLEEWRMRQNDRPAYTKLAQKVVYAVADLDRFMAERRVEGLK